MKAAWKIIAVVVVALAVVGVVLMKRSRQPQAPGAAASATGLPRLLDLGSTTCIPCKMMAPILEDLKKDYAGRLTVEFADVIKDPSLATPYGVKLIPTQIFFDASGKEFFRHEGFFSREDILAQFKGKGIDLAGGKAPAFERLEPAAADARARDTVCYMCDGDINPKTLVVVKTDKGDVRLCGPHCYFIMYSSLTEDKTGFEKKVSVTDYASGARVPATEAVYLSGAEEKSGRPWVKAFAARADADKERLAAGGNIVAWSALQENELSHRCGFCDRAVYPQDAARVIVGGVQTWGCCSHCALGVAALTGKDIEVYERDRLTGEPVVVKTLNGSVASLEPATAVAWFGQRKKPDGTWVSAGCFHQGFFTSEANLRAWVEANPFETGRLITIHQALADKMRLTPQQIRGACKIGECAPK